MRHLACAVAAVLAAVAAVPAGAASILYATAASQQRVDGFCLRGNGALAPTPTVHVTTGATQPRRLLAAPGVLYVAELDRVEAFGIGPHGGLTRLGHTKVVRDMSPVDLALGADGRTLYVVQGGPDRVAAYRLRADGGFEQDQDFTSCVQGVAVAGYRSVLVHDGLLYVAGAGQTKGVDVFSINPDGSLPTAPDACLTQTPERERSAATMPRSCRKRLVRPRSPIVAEGGMLYVEDRGRSRILAFQLAPEGTFSPSTCKHKRRDQQHVTSKTPVVAAYEMLLLHRSTLFGTQFLRGRIDAYAVRSDGHLAAHPRSTNQDVRMSPVGMAVADDVLYVAGGELDRVRAWRLRAADGRLASGAFFSQTDEQANSFPNDVAVAVLSEGCR